jgi:hypothetical protein
MKQTAVEWYAEEAMRLEIKKIKGNISVYQMLNELSNVLNQAKEMEKQQIVDAFGVGCQVESTRLIGYHKMAEQYYNETFKG